MKKRICEMFRDLRGLNFFVLLIAGCINAFGVTIFLSPVKLYDSGISGTSMLLAQITPQNWSLSIFLILLNVPLFMYGLKKQGVTFTVYSLFAVTVYSVVAWLITDILPIDVAMASPLAGNDLLLCALFGGMISGVGSGLTIRFGGAIDGIEVMSVIFAKKIGKNMKKLQKTLAKRVYFLYNNSARKFSVVFYTTHPGTCRSRVSSRENSNPNRFSDTHFPQCCRKSLENTNGYSLRDFLCLRKSGRLKTAKHLSA